MLRFRYNILPFDYNRVRLKTPINGTDYINASYITGIKSNQLQGKSNDNERRSVNHSSDLARFSNINFFASQGPLPNTCAHHLQMIFENDIYIVIMLTKIKEADRFGDHIGKKMKNRRLLTLIMYSNSTR